MNRSPFPSRSAKDTESDVVQRTSIVTYAILRELHGVLSDPQCPDDVTLGLLMGLTMLLDDKVGPTRCDQMMREAPTVVLQTDAHVGEAQVARHVAMLKAFGEHLTEAAQSRLLRGRTLV